MFKLFETTSYKELGMFDWNDFGEEEKKSEKQRENG